MLISTLNVMLFDVIYCLPLAQYLPATDNCLHSTLSVLSMLLLSTHYTVFVLLVSSVVRLLSPADTQNINIPFVRRYVLTCLSKIRLQVGLFTAVFMKKKLF